ncbi:MAG: site-specific integrase [Candidatus ainarchaeum sp.]|nr:site-specific integrase [Candidatus ainarchaeum sp.]
MALSGGYIMDYKKQLEQYLFYLDKEMKNQKYGAKHTLIDSHNAKLIREFAQNYRSLPTEPGDHKILVLCNRLKSIARMLNNKHLDQLDEEDLKMLNRVLKDRKFKSAYDYRKTLKKFLKIKDKKKYFELIDSDYLKSVMGKANSEKPVDPNEFWDPEHIDAYLTASKNYSPRQLAWASIWLTSGARPHEILGLRKNDLSIRNERLVINVREGKTGSRMIVLEPQETIQIMEYLKPYLQKLDDSEKLFDIGWTQQNNIHKRICKKIKLPENKSQKLYIARKMCLTKFYNTYGLAKAAAMAGHTPGAKAMRHYIALKETELLGEELHSITKKMCPNCKAENSANETQCYSCKSPLNKQAFTQILNQNLNDKINAHLDIIKKDFMIKMMEINQPIAQPITSPSK